MAESLVPQQFNRPPGWRFAFGGLNLREVPDAVPVGKFPSVCNIRPTPTQGVQTRPGYALLFSGGNLGITDVGVYAALNTNNAPRYLARDTANNIYLDTGSLVVTLSGATSSGVWMLPFRPSQSPQSWMYVASQGSYTKISAPSNNSVMVYKVGIAEPQNQVEACPAAPNLAFFVPTANNQWNNSGTAGAPSNGNRASDTLGVCILDPISADNRSSCQVGASNQYQIGEAVILNGGTQELEIEDVLPPVDPSSILAIQYASGNTGACVIFPAQSPFGLGPNATDLLGALRRGALVQYNNSEIAMVLSATQGPDGAVCFETSTNNSWVAGGSLDGIPAIILNSANATNGATLTAAQISSNIGIGLGYLSHAPLAFNPFTALLSTELKQEDQYIVFGFMVDNPNNLNEIRVQFNVDNENNATFTKNFYYYAIQPSQLAGVVTGATTQLQAALAELVQSTVPANTNLPQQTVPGANQWTELYIPLTSLIRVGGDNTRTLSDCNGVQVLVNAANNMSFTLGDLYVLSGGEPDVGDDGASYTYRMVPRNSMTGVRGNPTPPMRYGIRPRRERVFLSIPSSAYDPQIDTWDVERYGGSVTEFRYIGSAASTDDSFEDNYFDDSALAGSLMQVDNFEPWPSIDVPILIPAGGSVIITCVGTFITVAGYTNWPASTPSWLPGTLIQLGGQSAYTLRSRPVLVSANTWQFETQECVGNISPVYFQIQEPKVANSPNPYIWGPDVNGTFFGVGDIYRPGTVSFSKSYGPDSVPDSYNLDLCPPSEPLQGGVIKGGVGLVASITRWWAMYPQFSNPAKRYNSIEQPVGRGLAARYGVTTDGAIVYFWAHDGICVTSGGPYESLTDLDLYPLFPHEGVSGVNITRNGITYYAPDYTRSSTFRLRKAQTYLFADYQDSVGNPHTLVCDLRTKGWMCDIYNDGITNHLYTTSQQSSPTVIMSDDRGNVYQELDCAGDNHVPIPCTIAVPEWDGGDLRSQPLFGDSYLDCLPNSTITAQPVSGGNNVGSPTTIPNTRNRTFAVVSVDGEGSLQKFLGCVYSWTE